MSIKPETKIVNAIMLYLKMTRKGLGYKVHGGMYQESGQPDIDCSVWSDVLSCWLHCKLEVKTATGTATKLQLYRLARYKERDYVAGVVRSIEDVEALIKEYECSKLSQQ